MRKIVIITGAAMMLLGFSGVASAQDGGVEEKFYNFNDMLIDGDFKTPQGMIERSRSSAKFERAAKLKKSFLGKIQDSTQEDALAE